MFAPFADGKPTGKYETFASMKSGQFRAVGLAVGKDGALFVSADDNAEDLADRATLMGVWAPTVLREGRLRLVSS